MGINSRIHGVYSHQTPALKLYSDASTFRRSCEHVSGYLSLSLIKLTVPLLHLVLSKCLDGYTYFIVQLLEK